MCNYDDWKLATPPEHKNCVECENELDRFGECSKCAEKDEQDKIEAAEIEAMEDEFKNDPENMDNLRDIFFKLIDNNTVLGIIEKQHVKSIFVSAEIQLAMNQLRLANNKPFKRK